MSTGRSIVSTCCARAALAGNPSDGYCGAVVAIPITELAAAASVVPAQQFSVKAADRDLERLLRATAAAYQKAIGPLDDVTLSATTTIPRSVGLAGSSAIIIAALRALRAPNRWEPVELAQLALAVERDRLGIEAGLQDRLVQSVGRPVSMTFDPVGFRTIECPPDLPLFVAWSDAANETSDTVHRSLRRRFDAGDAHIRASMTGLAAQAQVAAAAIERGDLERLGAAMHRTFEIRTMMIDVDAVTMELARIGASAGAAVNSAGSGGSVVGLVQDVDRIERMADVFESAGFRFLAI